MSILASDNAHGKLTKKAKRKQRKEQGLVSAALESVCTLWPFNRKLTDPHAIRSIACPEHRLEASTLRRLVPKDWSSLVCDTDLMSIAAVVVAVAVTVSVVAIAAVAAAAPPPPPCPYTRAC